MPQEYRAPRPAIPGARLYDTASLAGVAVLFFGPAIALLTGASVLFAGTIGYGGIALFAGGIAARYGFAEHARPMLQLLKNLVVSLVVTSMFYLVFLLIVA
jgi:hypothetical protein